ncbi:Putative odorant receptor 13a [Camponotus floridanus]|uniref:Putative odorant receptor 13a n=1 Tax=Camponotus floridanus TaxID=104421 RepID=E2A3X2_CAMFO|nr:Putative odorant receptor 13a [Camponotus floridanus]
MNTVCHSIEFGLRVIGIWPDTSYAILRRILCISSLAMFQIFQYRYLIMHFGQEDIFIFMDVLSVTLAYSLLFIKLIIFTFNAHLLKEIIARIVEDWKRHDVSEKHTMTRVAYISRRFSNLIITMCAIVEFIYATSTLIKYKSSNQTNARELLVKMELPFEIKSTSVYIAVLVIQLVHQTSVASTEGMLNSLLITLVLHVCGQIDIMQQKLNKVTRKNKEQDAAKNIMKRLIVRHQKIISFAKDIENLFSTITLIHFISNTLVICCLGFLIVISGMIGDAAYESLWYQSNPSQNRDILLMIIRSQKHLTLTVGKFVDLSLQQFANIFQYKYLIMHFGEEDIFTLMDVLSVTLAYSLLFIKLIIFTFNAHLLNDIIARIVEDWKKDDVSEKHTMTRVAYISRRFSNLIITMCAIAVIVYAIGSLIRYKSGNQTNARELLVKMELPFEIKSTSVYIAVLVIQLVHQTSAASIEGMLNSLLVTLSGMIGDAVYESLWYQSNPSQNRDVLLMIIRSQKHLTLTVGKFMDLSLQQFANVRIY